MTGSDQTDVISVVQRDHRAIERLFEHVATAPDARSKQERFRALTQALSSHEAAEEIVVHPLARRAAGGRDVVLQRVKEEGHAKKLLSEMAHEEVTLQAWQSKFESLRTAVLEHAEQEERVEHPRLRDELSGADLTRAAARFRRAKRLAPTRPHPYGPNSRVGNLLLGPVLALVDRLRDSSRRST